MADRFESWVVSCPASTPPGAPVEVQLPFQGGVLLGFEIVIPAGHSGLTGIALGYGHRAVIPFAANTYFSGDDDVLRRTYNDKVPGVQWSAFVCNGDLQTHVWEVRFDYNELPDTAGAANASVLTADQIIEAGTQAMAEGA